MCKPSYDKVQCVVVGAGVIGLACAKRLSGLGLETLVLEKAAFCGSGTSSRNSEVIHAGIYYPTGSLKAQMCVAGRGLLYEYVKDRKIPYNQCGKLIIASTEQEILQLGNVLKQASQNNVEMRFIDSDEVKVMEPAVQCLKALYSPHTGIFDSHAYMLCLQGDAESNGAVFVYNCEVLSSSCNNPHGEKSSQTKHGGIILETSQGVINADIVINASGLHSIDFVKNLEGYPKHLVPKAYYAKGNYFTLNSSSSSPFSRLVYPVPEIGGLGIHATIDMAGSVRFGPDVEWLQEPRACKDSEVSNLSIIDEKDYVSDVFLHENSVPSEYTVDPTRATAFYNAIRKYWPDIREDSLIPAYSGIRPKLYGPSGMPPMSSSSARKLHDFIIEGPETHGVSGLVNLFGIESPGLTSSLSIADHITKLLNLN